MSILGVLDKNQKTPIPWDILDIGGEKARKAIVQILLEKSLPSIKIVTSYPFTKRKGKMITNTKISLIAEKVPLYMIENQFEREHLAMIATYKLINRFLNRGRIGNFYRFMAGNLPLYYAREWNMELYPAGYDIDSIPVKTKVGTPLIEECPLPEHPEEYADIISNIGIKRFSQKYSFYNRVRIYDLIKDMKEESLSFLTKEEF